MTSLPFFDDSQISRVLCIVAHPDDMEYGGSAAVARWTAMGVEVSYLLLTAGEAGMRSREPEEVGPLRIQEQRDACAEVGVEDLVVLDLPDGLLEPTLEVRRKIARRIRQFRPDAVVTQPWDLEVAWGLNHADHRAAGIAVVDAIRDADNPWVFRELHEEEGLTAWGVQWLLIAGAEPTHLIDVSGEPVERAVRSLQAHQAYLDELGDHMDPREMIESMTAGAAKDSDQPTVTRALGVRVYQM